MLLNALGEDKNPNKRVRQMLKAGVSKICDPDLLIEQVVVKIRGDKRYTDLHILETKQQHSTEKAAVFLQKKGFQLILTNARGESVTIHPIVFDKVIRVNHLNSIRRC